MFGRQTDPHVKHLTHLARLKGFIYPEWDPNPIVSSR